MSDKEKLQSLLERCPDSFESIILTYLLTFTDDFSATRIRSLMSKIDQNVLQFKILGLEGAVKISSERATYVEEYLSGRMYTTEEAARENVGKQIEHVRRIKEVCEKQ